MLEYLFPTQKWHIVAAPSRNSPPDEDGLTRTCEMMFKHKLLQLDLANASLSPPKQVIEDGTFLGARGVPRFLTLQFGFDAERLRSWQQHDNVRFNVE